MITVVSSETGCPFSMKSSSMSDGSPTVGFTIPAAPSGITCADTALDSSVISVTVAVPPETDVTLPASPPPPSPPGAITGMSSSIPAPEPLSIWTLDCQLVGERAITRAVTGSVPLREQLVLRQAHEAAQLLRLALRGLRLGEVRAQVGDLVLQLLVLATSRRRRHRPS